MSKIITREELSQFDGAVDFQGLLSDVLTWQSSVEGGDWYDDIIYNTLESVIDIIVDNTFFEGR